MQQLVSIYLFLAPVLLGLLMLWEHHRGRVPMLSLRNVSLVGLIVFQYFSGGLHLWTDDYVGFPVNDPARTGLIYAGILTAFTILFLLMYNFGWPMRGIADRVPLTNATPRAPTLMAMAVIFIGLGFVFTIVPIPYIGIITNYFGIGLLAVSAGFVGWVIARNYMNPIYYLIGGAILMPAMIISVLGTYGRRHLVAVAFAFVWGAFYARLRQMKTGWLVAGVLIVSMPAIYVISAFTAVRNIAEQTTAATLFRGLTAPAFHRTIPDLLSGQSCGPVSFFVIENYPSNHRAIFLNNLTYFFLTPIPRALWTSKPETLSNEIAHTAQLTGLDRRAITLPPGVVGYIAAEGGIIALFVYAWFFGTSMRFFDRLIARAPANPLIIMPVGCALGQILGLFRGEMSMFLFIQFTSFAGSYTACLIVGRIMDKAIAKALPLPEHEDAHIEENDHSGSIEESDTDERSSSDTGWDHGTNDDYADYGNHDGEHRA